MIKSRLAFLLCLICASSFAQTDDEKQIDETIKKLYATINFKDSTTIMIDTLTRVFTEKGTLVANWGKRPFIFTAAEYADSMRKNIRAAKIISAREVELTRRVDIFGKVAHVLTSYELTLTRKDGATVNRGLNSIQLIKQDGKWLIHSLIFDRETDQLKLPVQYLPK